MRLCKHQLTAWFFFTVCVPGMTMAGEWTERRLGGDLEVLVSHDVAYWNTGAETRLEGNAWSWSGNLQARLVTLDYQPNRDFEIVTRPQSRDEKRYLLNFEGQYELKPEWELRLAGSLAKGFSSHTQIWLDEYYRQFWKGIAVEGDPYEDPDPWGIGVGLGFRYEYLPLTGFFDFNLAYNREVIAPGYEFPVEGEEAGQLVRGVSEIETLTAEFLIEQAVTDRLRLQGGWVITETTSRDLRFTFTGKANFALSENWVFRLGALYARESPAFEASKWEGVLHYAVNESWSAGFTASYYKDTGEIEQSNLATDAAPGLHATQLRIYLHWRNLDESQLFALSLGPYFSDYGPTGTDQRFNNLYRERDWFFARLAYSFRF